MYMKIRKLSTTNSSIVSEFVNYIHQNYLFKQKGTQYSFVDFANLLKEQDFWIINPGKIREEFLLFALKNQQIALLVVKRAFTNEVF